MSEFQVPAIFQQGGMSPALRNELGGQDDSLAEGIGQSYPVIGYKGKVWTLRYRGQKYTFADDKGFALPYLDLIILQQAKTKSKSYFKEWAQNESNERPLCASMDGIVPDAGVPNKQSDSCALCPRNVWRTDPKTGRKGRECTDFKRLAVLLHPSMTEPLLGLQLLEPVFLRVPPASLNALATMGDTMDRQGYHYASYVTRVSFDPTKAWPEMKFTPVQKVTDEEAPLIMKLRNDPVAARITVGDPVRQTAIPFVASPYDQSGNGQIVSQPQVTPVAVTSLLRSIVTAPPAMPTMVHSPQTSPVQGGNGLFSPKPSTTPGTQPAASGGAQNALMQPSAPWEGPPLNSVSGMSDAGEPEESDADIDAQIAAIIAAK